MSKDIYVYIYIYIHIHRCRTGKMYRATRLTRTYQSEMTSAFPRRKCPSQRVECYSCRTGGGSFLRRVISIRRREHRCACDSSGVRTRVWFPVRREGGSEYATANLFFLVSAPVRLPNAYSDLRERASLFRGSSEVYLCGPRRTYPHPLAR